MAKISYCCPFSEANLRIFLQVSSFFSSYKDCNGSCVRKSVFCPPKDVCESPNFLCKGECLPAYHSQWYQVWQKEPNVVCYNQCLPDFYRQRYQVWISRLSTEVAYFLCGTASVYQLQTVVTGVNFSTYVHTVYPRSLMFTATSSV
jgi:hypothetical protein